MIYTEEGVQSGLQRFLPESNKDVNSTNNISDDQKQTTYKEIFTEAKYRKMLRVGILLGTIQQVSGINAGIFYSTSIFKELGGGAFMSKVYTFITGLIFMISSLASIPLLTRFGRRALLISGQILLAIDLSLLGILTSFDIAPIYVLIIGVILIFVFFSYSLGSTLWLHCGEALIEKIMGISATVNLLWVCIVTASFPIIVEYLGINYAFLFFAVCMVLGAIYCCFDIIETKDKTKPEIFSRMFGSGN